MWWLAAEYTYVEPIACVHKLHQALLVHLTTLHTTHIYVLRVDISYVESKEAFIGGRRFNWCSFEKRSTLVVHLAAYIAHSRLPTHHTFTL